MDHTRYRTFMNGMKAKKAEELRGQLLYLERLGYGKDVRQFVTKDTDIWSSINAEERTRTIAEFNSTGMVQVPEGFSRVQTFSTFQEAKSNSSQKLSLKDDNGNVYRIELPEVQKVKVTDMQLRFYSENRKAVLCVTEFLLTETSDADQKIRVLRLEGYTFEK